MTVERLELVPYAKPELVIEPPPVDEMLAFRVRDEVDTEVGGEVVRVGATTDGVLVEGENAAQIVCH